VFDADSHYDHLMAAAQDMEDVRAASWACVLRAGMCMPHMHTQHGARQLPTLSSLPPLAPPHARPCAQVVKSAAQAADSGPHLGRANGGGKSVGFRVGPKDDSYDSLEA
jgi:hypothetical protein